MEVKPTITISLKKHLADFCRHEFAQDKQGNIVINRKHDIGKTITAKISASNFPIKKPEFENAVTFILPLVRPADLRNKFLYVAKWEQQQIQDYIEAQFHLRCSQMFVEGARKGLQQKIIIESILKHYNIKHTAISFEAVKKNDYRTNRRLRKNIGTELASYSQ